MAEHARCSQPVYRSPVQVPQLCCRYRRRVNTRPPAQALFGGLTKGKGEEIEPSNRQTERSSVATAPRQDLPRNRSEGEAIAHLR